MYFKFQNRISAIEFHSKIGVKIEFKLKVNLNWYYFYHLAFFIDFKNDLEYNLSYARLIILIPKRSLIFLGSSNLQKKFNVFIFLNDHNE